MKTIRDHINEVLKSDKISRYNKFRYAISNTLIDSSTPAEERFRACGALCASYFSDERSLIEGSKGYYTHDPFYKAKENIENIELNAIAQKIIDQVHSAQATLKDDSRNGYNLNEYHRTAICGRIGGLMVALSVLESFDQDMRQRLRDERKDGE